MSTSTKSEYYTFSLSIAELGVTATCDNPSLAEALGCRYQNFPLEGEAHICVQIHLSGQERSSALLDTGTTFEDGVLHFTAPGYQGSIHEADGTGQLRLSSTQPVEDVEYFIRVVYALLTFHAGGIMLHAAGIVRNGQAYLFFGHSGSGKTTVARLSPNDIILNDDLVILVPDDGGWRVFGTPFWNPAQVKPAAHSAPLTGLFRLVQNKRVFIEETSPSEAIAELISNVPVIPADPLRSATLLGRLYKILGATPVHKLHFLPEASFWNVVGIK